jgi:hypothetical protein
MLDSSAVATSRSSVVKHTKMLDTKAIAEILTFLFVI